MNKNTRVLLCNPPFPRKVKGVPLSLLYLGGALRHPAAAFKGKAALLDLNVQKGRGLLERTIKEFRPTHFAITRFTPNAPESAKLIRRAKELGNNVITVSGGPHEISYGKETSAELEGCIDHVVRDFDGVGAFLRILGIKSSLQTLELLPDYGLIADYSKYQFPGLFSEKMTQMVTSTGCNCACSFCGVKRTRLADTEVVIQNISHALSLGFGALVFDDANFITNRKRTLELMRTIQERKLSFEWGCQTRADGMGEEVLEAMRASGCTYICTALESADRRILEAINKGIEPSDVVRALENMRKLGIRAGLYVMFGHPIEVKNPEIAEATLDMVEELRPEFLSISMYACYRGILPGVPVSREKEWLEFDEGWGAVHDAPVDYAARILELLKERATKNPEIWNKIKRF